MGFFLFFSLLFSHRVLVWAHEYISHHPRCRAHRLDRRDTPRGTEYRRAEIYSRRETRRVRDTRVCELYRRGGRSRGKYARSADCLISPTCRIHIRRKYLESIYRDDGASDGHDEILWKYRDDRSCHGHTFELWEAYRRIYHAEQIYPGESPENPLMQISASES